MICFIIFNEMLPAIGTFPWKVWVSTKQHLLVGEEKRSVGKMSFTNGIKTMILFLYQVDLLPIFLHCLCHSNNPSPM